TAATRLNAKRRYTVVTRTTIGAFGGSENCPDVTSVVAHLCHARTHSVGGDKDNRFAHEARFRCDERAEQTRLLRSAAAPERRAYSRPHARSPLAAPR